MTTKLKPCPFCGRIPRMWDEEEDAPGGPVVVGRYISCKCGARLYSYGDNEEELTKRWNKRISTRK